MKTSQYIALEELYGAHNYHPLDVVIRRAKGVWVYDVEGKKYLDCLSAYSALNQGHCHPKILKALVKQGKRVTLTSRAFRNDQLPALYKALHDLTGYDMSLPMNSGAEAVETAIKAARKWAYHVKGVPKHLAEIICCSGNFHGRTTTIVGFSTEEQYREGFGPFTPGFRIVKYGSIEDLRKNISSNTAAFLVEPIQGEAGIVIPPEGYLHEAARLCKENNVLLIADEIQTGLGRTGRLFACDWEDVRPDVMIVGKALGGGVPIAAVCGKTDVMSVLNPVGHTIMSGTYTGHLTAVMGAIACQTELAKPGFYGHLNGLADRLYAGITEALRVTGVPGIVQGIGARFGLYLGVTAPVTNYRQAVRTNREMEVKFILGCVRRGLYLHDYGHTMHHGFSSQHTEADIDQSLHIIEDALRELKTK